MEIIIEIGTPEQKELIAQELKFLEIVPQQVHPPINITRIIVTADFDQRVNEIQGTSTYRSNRGLENNGVSTIGKMIKDGDGYAIVVSPLLYSETYDIQVRYFILLHELAHVINQRDFPPIPTDTYVNNLYTHNIYTFYDEYYADRLAYHLCDTLFPEKSKFREKHTNNDTQGYLNLLTSPQYYETIKAEIEAFRTHANVDEFLKKVTPNFDIVGIILAHTYAIHHQFPGKIAEAELAKSKFVNEKTVRLMEYMAKKYNEKSVDLSDGRELIIGFMTNFGMMFEHRDYGAYCHVLDI